MTLLKLYCKQLMCSLIMLVFCMGSVYSQSVVDFGTDLYSTKYYESMRAANPPAGEWYAIDYDDSNWNTYTNPLNFPQYDAFWVRRTFYLVDDPANHSFQIKLAHDDGAKVYINGNLIHNDNGCCGRYNYVNVPSEYLVNGTNVLAVYVIDTGGSQCLECFISATDGSDIIIDLPTEPILTLSRSNFFLYNGVDNYSDYTLTSSFITPTGPIDTQITWTSSNQDVVSVIDGYVVAKSVGNAVVSASITYNGVTYSKECSVEVRAIAQGSKLVIVEEPGTLGSLLTDDEKNNLESLTVFGKLNGDDITVLRYMAGRNDNDGKVSSGKLSDLDIYNVEFVQSYFILRVEGYYISGSMSVSPNTIPSKLFVGCSSLTSVVIPLGATSIGESAFYNCSSLTSIDFSAGVTSIGGSAFYGCSSLTSIDLPAGVTSIEGSAFYGCSSLTSIDLPAGVTSIEGSTFNGCSSLTSIDIPSGVTSIGDRAFYGCSSLTSIDLPAGVMSIEGSAFNGCSSLRLITICGNEMADFNAFKQIQLIYDQVLIYVADGLYDQYANTSGWEDVSKRIISADMLELRTVEVTADESRSSVFTALGDKSLYTANLKIKGSINGYDIMTLRNKTIHLLYLDLSEANIVANDGGYEYYTGCSLKSDNVLGNHSFANLQLREVILPKSLESIDNCAFDACKKLEKAVLYEGLISIGKFAFRDCILRDVQLPGSLLKIGDNSFRYCKLSGTLRIPDQISVIESGAFAYTKIDSLIIGQNVSVINGGHYWSTEQGNVMRAGEEGGAFSGCDKLKGIMFNRKLKGIGSYVFQGCSNLTEVNLPYTVEKIDDWAFQDCAGLESIKIPSMTKSIGNGAFGGCNKIRNVYTYTVEPTEINQETFSVYSKATLNVPKTSADLYIYNTQWSQFTKVREFDEPYDAFYLNGDVELDDHTGRMSGEPDAEMYETSGFIIEGDSLQELKNIELSHNGTNGASIIGASNDATGSQVNLTAQSMNVNIGVDGNRWYFFCFPFDVERDSVECTTDYVFYSYDGGKRAKNGSGWTKMNADFGSLQKGVGYIFQTSRTGVLTIHVGKEYLTFSAKDESQMLHAYEASSAANASWNFLGNPYISYYDVQDLAKEYDAPIVVWNGKGYDVYKPGDDDYQLKPFEAFFVQKEAGTQYVEFLPENRITYNQATARASQRAAMRASLGTPISLDRQLVNITIMDKDSVSDRTRIVYSTKASMDYEIGVDAAKFQSDGVPQIYTLNGTTKYAINERPMGTDDIKLGYTAPKSGTYTLSVPRHDAEVEIYDNVVQAVVDFTFGDYVFQSQAGTFNDRFVIHKTSGGVTAVENGFRLDGLTVTSYDGGIEIEGQLQNKIQIYSESGILLAEPNQTGRLELGSDVYVVKIGERSIKMSVN